MTTSRSSTLHAALAAASLLLPACNKAGPGAKPVANITCPDGALRAQIDCSTALGLKEKVVDANASLGKLGLGVGAKYEERAVGQVTDSTYQLALRLESLCKEYNACVMPQEAYTAEAAMIRAQLDQHVGLVGALGREPSLQAGDAIWTNARPDLAKGRIALEYALQATPPGGAPFIHRDGEPLQSGDGFRVLVHTNVPAHVYILLMSSQGEPSLLFPNPAMGQSNPIAGDADVSIPNDGVFELDAVTGQESLQILASTQPLADIEQRLASLSQAENPPADAGAGLLGQVGSLLCDGAGNSRGVKYTKTLAECDGKKSRGVVYKKAKEAARVAAVPGDDVVVVQHRIDHR